MVFVLETLISNQNHEKFVCSKSRWTGGNIQFYSVSSLWKVALSTDGRQEISCFTQHDTPVARLLHERNSVSRLLRTVTMPLKNELTHFGLDHILCLPIRSLGGFELPCSEC